MNMAAGISSPQCPKCSRSVGHWMDRQITHICASCGAPLIRFRASRALRLYRIFTVADLIRIMGLLVTVAAILSAVAFPRGIRAAVFMVATALLAFGAADIMQETFAMRARRRRSEAIMASPQGLFARQRFGGQNENMGHAMCLRRAIGSLSTRNSP